LGRPGTADLHVAGGDQGGRLLPRPGEAPPDELGVEADAAGHRSDVADRVEGLPQGALRVGQRSHLLVRWRVPDLVQVGQGLRQARVDLAEAGRVRVHAPAPVLARAADDVPTAAFLAAFLAVFLAVF